MLCGCSQRLPGLDSQAGELSLLSTHLLFSRQWTLDFLTFSLSLKKKK